MVAIVHDSLCDFLDSRVTTAKKGRQQASKVAITVLQKIMVKQDVAEPCHVEYSKFAGNCRALWPRISSKDFSNPINKCMNVISQSCY
eukprot:m.265095 g.265095  ORF g.265095 m.265095 type:complete len:88 (-) comp16234_c0_seq9:1916-2179(-)